MVAKEVIRNIKLYELGLGIKPKGYDGLCMIAKLSPHRGINAIEGDTVYVNEDNIPVIILTNTDITHGLLFIDLDTWTELEDFFHGLEYLDFQKLINWAFEHYHNIEVSLWDWIDDKEMEELVNYGN